MIFAFVSIVLACLSLFSETRPAYDHSETGFLWSWNFMISKRWKQISNTGATGDIGFMDKILGKNTSAVPQDHGVSAQSGQPARAIMQYSCYPFLGTDYFQHCNCNAQIYTTIATP